MISIPDTYVRQTEVAEDEAYLEYTQRAFAAGTLPWQVEQAAATKAAKAKLSEPMTEALRHIAFYGEYLATVKANTRHALLTRELVIGNQLTATGWAALPAGVRHDALAAAYDAAVEQENGRLAEMRTWTAINLRIAQAPADATWFGQRFSADARTDEDAAMADVKFGPWIGQANAWRGIMAAVADEANRLRARGLSQRSLTRLATIGATFLSDSTATRVVVGGLGFQIWTNYSPPVPVSDIALAEQAAYAEQRKPVNPNQDDPFAPFDAVEPTAFVAGPDWRDEPVPSCCPLCGCEFVGPYRRVECKGCGAEVTPIPLTAVEWTGEGPEPVDVTNRVADVSEAHSDALETVARYLAPLTSVADVHGSTGRVVRYDLLTDTVTVRMHRPSYVQPGQNYCRENAYDRDSVRTTADLWQSIEDVARSQMGLREPKLFWVKNYWAGIDDPDCRHIPWGDTMHDKGRYWDRADNVSFVMLASYGDSSNSSTVDASNYMVCKRDWFDGMADPLLYEVGNNTRDGVGIAARIGDNRWNIAQLAELESIVEALTEYPLIDEMHYSDYESGLQDEWWDNDGQRDVTDMIDTELERRGQLDSDGELYTWETAPINDLPYSTQDRAELLETMLYSGDNGVEWSSDAPESMYPTDLGSAVAYVIHMVYATDVPQRYGPVSTPDGDAWLTETEIGEYALPATHRNQLMFPLNGVSCERCGTGTSMLGNGTYSRHTDPTTHRHCHASGTKVSATL